MSLKAPAFSSRKMAKLQSFMEMSIPHFPSFSRLQHTDVVCVVFNQKNDQFLSGVFFPLFSTFSAFILESLVALALCPSSKKSSSAASQPYPLQKSGSTDSEGEKGFESPPLTGTTWCLLMHSICKKSQCVSVFSSFSPVSVSATRCC